MSQMMISELGSSTLHRDIQPQAPLILIATALSSSMVRLPMYMSRTERMTVKSPRTFSPKAVNRRKIKSLRIKNSLIVQNSNRSPIA